ncbi:hypothetical protein CFP56_042655 [Quercus suber]|uniref:Uncharacterized protein n=1 Tax=Quercus suber TaxID=58331 RepID=A0AAW0LHV3_QUESU
MGIVHVETLRLIERCLESDLDVFACLTPAQLINPQVAVFGSGAGFGGWERSIEAASPPPSTAASSTPSLAYQTPP